MCPRCRAPCVASGARRAFAAEKWFLGVANQRVLVREHTAPALPEKELRQALPYQVAELLPLPVSEAILDFYPMSAVDGSSPPMVQGLLVAAVREVIEANIAAIEGAGLQAVGVDLSPFAMLRALARGSELGGCRTIVFLGGRTSYLVVAVDGVPRFVRIIPAGRETVIEAVSETLGLDASAAEAVLEQHGLRGGDDATGDRAIRGAFQSILGSVRSTNTYYSSNLSGESIEGLVLLGAGSQVPGLASMFAESLGLPVSGDVTLDGFEVAATVDAAVLDRVRADLAVPAGLALDLGRSS